MAATLTGASETDGVHPHVEAEVALAPPAREHAHRVGDDPGVREGVRHAVGLFVEALSSGIVLQAQQCGEPLVDAAVRVLGRPKTITPFVARHGKFDDTLRDNNLAVLEFDAPGADKATVEAEVKAMCDKLLANTVIETYHVEFI